MSEEQRDRRISSELERLETAIEHNGMEIARLLREMQALRTETQALRTEVYSQFRWTIGLLFPLVAGMLAIIIRVFLVGTF